MSDTQNSTRYTRRHRIAALVAIPALVGGTAVLGASAASAASAQTGCGTSNCVDGSITIAQSFSLSVSTPSITFTGSPGGQSNFPTVSGAVLTNDTRGYTVSVAPTGPNMTGAGNAADTFPVSDISVGGGVQANAVAGTGTCASQNASSLWACTTSLTGAVVTDSSGSMPAGGVANFSDQFGFAGPSAPGPGSYIPAAPADTYSDGLQYSAVAG